MKRKRAKDNNDNVIIITEQGNSKEYALRKLKKSAPRLHKRVIQGELSANKAMVEAGFRYGN